LETNDFHLIRSMNPNSLKLNVIKNVANFEDVQLLNQIHSLLVKNKKEVILNIPPEQEIEIKQARKRFDTGEYSTQESIEKLFSRLKN
jgi:hypothetical protein